MLSLLLVFHPAIAQDRGARADDAAYVGEDDSYTPPPLNRLWYSNASFVRINPLGLVNLHKVGWRHRLSTKPSIFLQDTYTFVGLSALVSPAYTRVGLYAEAQPLALTRFFVEATGTGYYGTFDQTLTFASDERYSDDTIDAEGDRARSALGWTFTVGGTLRAKAGPIAVRTTAQVLRYDLNLGGKGLYFYDQFWDRLAPNQGWMALNDLDVLYVQGKLRLGARHTFSDTLDGSGGATDAALSHHRVGPLFAWQFADKAPGAKFNQPTLFVVSQWWLQHPYRTGEEQPAALPVFAAGFAFNGDHRISPL